MPKENQTKTTSGIDVSVPPTECPILGSFDPSDEACVLVGHVTVKNWFEDFQHLIECVMVDPTTVDQSLFIATVEQAKKRRMLTLSDGNPGSPLVSSSLLFH